MTSRNTSFKIRKLAKHEVEFQNYIRRRDKAKD